MYLTTKSGRKIKLPTDEEDAVITQQAIEDDTYLNDEELNQLKPVAEIAEMQTFLKSRGRPIADIKKDRITIRLSPEVTAYFRATGKGWQTRMDEVLQEYIATH